MIFEKFQSKIIPEDIIDKYKQTTAEKKITISDNKEDNMEEVNKYCDELINYLFFVMQSMPRNP